MPAPPLPPIPEFLLSRIESQLNLAIPSEAAPVIEMFWKAFMAIEEATISAIEVPRHIEDRTYEGGFILRHLNRYAREVESAGSWLARLGMPISKITDDWLAQHGSKLDGDGILLPDGNLLSWAPYALPDARWSWAAMGYLALLMDPSMRPTFRNTPTQLVIPDDEPITIALAGDWGTGNWDDDGHDAPAAMIGRHIKSLVPDVSVHLGDVYPLGLEGLERKNLADVWPSGKYGSFALNSNHEMYAGGRGYYLEALGHPLFEGQQRTGYFSIDYGRWIVLALDTAFFDTSLIFSSGGLSGDPNEEQNQFIREVGERVRKESKALLLLTHYPGLTLDGTQETMLSRQLCRLLGQRPDVWYWGHNHKGVVYSDRSEFYGRSHARCLGHGSLPFGEASKLTLADGSLKPEIEYLTRTPLGHGGANRVRNGFAVLTLTRDSLQEEFVDQIGETEWENEIELPPSGSEPGRKILGSMAGLLVLLGAFSFMDWGRLAAVLPGLSDSGVGLFRALLKLATVYISASLVWTVGGDAVRSVDKRRMTLAFVAIAAADSLFVLGQYAGMSRSSYVHQILAGGVLLFGAAHVLFLVRHTEGWREALSAGRFSGHGWTMLLSGGAMLLATASLVFRYVKLDWFGWLLVVYLSVLTASLFAAVVTRWIGRFSRCNSNLILAGLLLFFLCDVTVVMGMSAIVGHTAKLVITSMTWLFYVPALLFLSLSAYRRSGVRNLCR